MYINTLIQRCIGDLLKLVESTVKDPAAAHTVFSIVCFAIQLVYIQTKGYSSYQCLF